MCFCIYIYIYWSTVFVWCGVCQMRTSLNSWIPMYWGISAKSAAAFEVPDVLNLIGNWTRRIWRCKTIKTNTMRWYIYRYTNKYKYIYICIYIYMYMYMYMCIYIYTFICICVYIYTHTILISLCNHAYIYMYMYMYTYIYMYMCNVCNVCMYVCMYVCM